MSKSVNAGELRTAVYFKRVIRTTNENGYPIEVESGVFEDELPVMCKWVNVHGTESFEAAQQQLKEPAILTMRYSPKLEDVTLIIYRAGDLSPFEVISTDNVERRNVWLEIKIQRKAKAR